MNRRIILLGGGGLLLIVLILLGAGSRTAHRPVVSPPNAPNGVQYTSAITGLTTTDLPAETGASVSGGPSTASVTMENIHTLYDNLSNDQALYTQHAMEDFLLAHSGLSNVRAGILDNLIIQSGNTIQFTLVSLHPYGKYQVTVQAVNSQQTEPSITFKRQG